MLFRTHFIFELYSGEVDMRNIVLIVFLLAGAFFGYESSQLATVAPTSVPDAEWRSGEQVSGSGSVVRVLSDDNQGSRHQRFILRLPTGRTVLIAHNIDLAPRIRSLKNGDTVSFYGQYETNDRGGVIHWTHDDPQGSHVGGWLEHKGERYH